MADRREDLRSSAESIQRDAEEVDRLEKEKLSLDPGDPRVDGLSQRIKGLIDTMAVKAAAEKELAAEMDGPTGEDPSR